LESLLLIRPAADADVALDSHNAAGMQHCLYEIKITKKGERLSKGELVKGNVRGIAR
jgi:hypothetical protein